MRIQFHLTRDNQLLTSNGRLESDLLESVKTDLLGSDRVRRFGRECWPSFPGARSAATSVQRRDCGTHNLGAGARVADTGNTFPSLRWNVDLSGQHCRIRNNC